MTPAALGWEMFEALSDAWLGTRLTHGRDDTLRDLHSARSAPRGS